MIKVTINGETKRFESGLTVYDIIDGFDRNYTSDTCAVRKNSERLSLEDVITEDCELELLTFRDLGASRRPAYDESSDESADSDESDFDFSSEYFDPYTFMAFSQMFGGGFFGSNDSMGMFGESTGMTNFFSRQYESAASGAEEPQSEESEADETQADGVIDEEVSEELLEQDDAEPIDEIEPESDGEFISVSRFGNGELSPDMLADEDVENTDPSPSSKSVFSETEDMQMHLGVPKIDDIVAELLVDIEPKDDAADYSEQDYSIDDEDMDAFLTSQIIPESSSAEIPHAETVELTEIPEISAEQEITDSNGYNVDDDSIDDFVDYAKTASPAPLPSAVPETVRPAQDRQHRRHGIPLFVKAAAMLVLLVGVGWLVSRIAIQAAGAPDAIQKNSGKTPVSASDVSGSDVSGSDIVTTASEKKTTTSSTTVTSVTETTTTTTTTATTTTTQATTRATTTTVRKTTKATTTRRTTTTTTRKTTKTKKTTTTTASTTADEPDTTKATDPETTTTTPSATTTTTTATQTTTTTTTTKPTTTTTTKSSPILGPDEPYNPDDVVG